MIKIIKSILIIIGIGLFLNATVLAIMTNFNFGIIITLVLGLILLFIGIYFERIRIAAKTGVLRWFKYFAYTVILLLSCMIVFLAIYGNIDNVKYNEDAVIVLGAGIRGETPTLPLKHRLDKAISYINKNPNAIIVVSGGQGFQEDITEALAMERYLIANNISQDKIIKEERATSTYENIKHSKEILDRQFSEPYKTVIITNDFHIYRATQISETFGLDVSHYHSKTDWYTVPLNYLRECAAVLKFWILKQ